MSTPSEILDQKPPSADSDERDALGSFLLDPSSLDKVAGKLRPEHFREHRNEILHRHLVAMRNGGPGAINVTLLSGRLKEASDYENIGGGARLAELMQSVPVAAHAEKHAGRVIEYAARRAIRRLGEDLIRDAQSGQVSAADLARQARTALETVADSAQQNRFPALSCAELDATEFNIEYLVEGVLVAGQPCLVAGGKKSLKTSIIIDLGISLAMGGFFLGKLKVNRACRVGIMSGESGMATIQETARRICYAAGYHLGDIGNLIFSESLPQFDKAEHMDALRGFIEANELEVLILDPAYLCMPGGDAGNLFVQGGMLRMVNEVCASIGTTMVLAHHTRKSGKADPYSPPELEDIAWSGFQEWTRQWLLLGRREPYEPGTGDHRLWLNVGGSAGHSNLWALNINEGTNTSLDGRFWEVEVLYADQARTDSRDRHQEAKEEERLAKEAKRLENDRARICEAMAKFSEGETKNIIKGFAGMSGSRFDAAMATLLEEKSVEPCGITKPDRRTPYPGYKLCDTP